MMQINNNLDINLNNNNFDNTADIYNASTTLAYSEKHQHTKTTPKCQSTLAKSRYGVATFLTGCSLFTAALALPSIALAEQVDDYQNEDTLAVLEATSNEPLPDLESLENSPELKLTLPDIQHFQTKAGVPVAFVHSSALPIVDVDLRFNAGSARDNDIRPDGFGIAGMTATMLTQGTKTLSEEDFTRAVETLGISLSSHAYKDMFTVSIRSLSDEQHLEPALELVKQMLAEPRFDDDILARNKAQLMVGLQQQQQDPSSVASLAFNKALFGDHPYAHPSSGTLETVPTLSTQDLADFKSRFLVASNASLAITGDLTLDEAKTLADSLTQVLPKGQPAPTLADPKPLDAGKRIHIPFDSTQTTVIMGQLGDKRSNSAAELQSQANFAVGNEVLAGGDFNARLMTEIRKNLGYTYGISGHMAPMLARGSYQIGFSTRNDKADAAIDATLATINSTLQDGISDEELQLTKDNLKNSFPMSFASNAGINGLLSMMNFYELPDSYLTDYLSRIDKVDLKAANDTLNQKIEPNKFLIVTVGNGTKDGLSPTTNTLEADPTPSSD